MKSIITILSIIFLAHSVHSQSEDEQMIEKIFNKALTEGHSYQMLYYLSNQIGGRLSGSPEAAAAVEWSRQKMLEYGFEKVYLQEVMVPHWVRGKQEVARIINSKTLGTADMTICAIGNSVGTGPNGVLGKIVEVKSFDELQKLGTKGVEGKIVFFNRAFDQTLYNTGQAYGKAVEQRVYGASEAVKYGANGVVVRSMASNIDDVPHTGTLRYDEELPKIPAVAISTLDAETLSETLAKEPAIDFYFETHCEMLPDVLSYNVIGEMRGSEKPDEFIVVGGHLDAWDLGDGAHDDGAGCVQSIEVLRLFKELNYKPKRTIRVVMFMNEENGLRGGTKYAEKAKENGETHIAAFESDSGGFSPRGFTTSGDDDVKSQLAIWAPLLNPYGLHTFDQPGGGADIGPLRDQGTVLFGLSPDRQRYFNYHHTTSDTFDKVNKRELELGAASMASMVYLIDKYGI